MNVVRKSPLCVLTMVLFVLPLCAQRTRYTPSFGAEGKPPMTVVDGATFSANSAADEERCLPWKLAVGGAKTVSVTSLQVPAKAREEYEKACDANNNSKLGEAEQHARSAIEKFQDYPAAWVLFAVILEQQHKGQEAGDACSHAATIDATYLPAHLCTAEVSVRSREWGQVLGAADRALGLRPEGDPYIYYYRATACLHLNNPVDAKKNALQALGMDANHDVPSLHLLMAQIYTLEGDTPGAIAQLQQFLKHPADRQQEEAAKRLLAKLESQPSPK